MWKQLCIASLLQNSHIPFYSVGYKSISHFLLYGKEKARGAADSFSFDPLQKQQPSSALKLSANKDSFYIEYNAFTEAVTTLL